MFRLLLALILGGAIFVLIGWQFGLFPPEGSDDGSGVAVAPEKQPAPDLGKDLYTPAGLPIADEQLPERKVDAVVVLGNMVVIDRPDVPAQIPGQLMFIGEEVPEGVAQVTGLAAFLAEPFDYTKVNHGLVNVVKLYRRLDEGQMVYEDQMVAMIDTSKSLSDMDLKRGKVIASKAISDGAEAIAKEAYLKYKSAEELYNRRAIPLEEFRSAKLTSDKMSYDAIEKVQAWNLAQIEDNAARTIYNQHEIRNKIPARLSIIQKIHKQRGEAVKELEPVMQLNRLDRLRAEAQIEAELSPRFQPDMLVTIEPSLVDSPPKTYRGHSGPVNCLAVTHDRNKPLIVSGGEDRWVMVWNRFVASALREFKHPEAVKALATSPPGAARNLVLTGCADGSIRLFDLDVKDKPLLKTAKIEQSVAITALAFSPDGTYFASGAADGSIVLWTTDKVEPYYAFDEAHGVTDPHHGAISALHFTPQCKLVSASLDNSLRVWSLKEKGALLEFEPLGGRTGSIPKVDVSADGRWMLFDQGKTLQIRAVADGRMVNTLQNPGGVIPFETLALFSPDASLLLTAGASEGRLQLWQTPTAAKRGFEVRQLATPQRHPVSCAAFAPLTDYQGEGSFAVSGSKDGQIYLWPLPSRKEVDEQPIRNVRVSQVNASLTPGTNQVSIGVEVPNFPTKQYPKGRLEPGRSVVIVIE